MNTKSNQELRVGQNSGIAKIVILQFCKTHVDIMRRDLQNVKLLLLAITSLSTICYTGDLTLRVSFSTKFKMNFLTYFGFVLCIYLYATDRGSGWKEGKNVPKDKFSLYCCNELTWLQLHNSLLNSSRVSFHGKMDSFK